MSLPAHDLIHELEQRGIWLELEDDTVRAMAPKGMLTPDLVERLKANKETLILDLRVMTTLRQACEGIEGITPAQFRALCTPEDIEYIQAGRFSLECLRAYARSFAEGIQSGRIVFHPTNTAGKHSAR